MFDCADTHICDTVGKKMVTIDCVWCVCFVPISVVLDLIVELHADITVARLNGQPVYLYLLTCNLSLTGLTKTLTVACCNTQTHWTLFFLFVYMCACMHGLCVYACFRISVSLLDKNREDKETKQWQKFSSSLSLFHLWLPISSH